MAHHVGVVLDEAGDRFDDDVVHHIFGVQSGIALQPVLPSQRDLQDVGLAADAQHRRHEGAHVLFRPAATPIIIFCYLLLGYQPITNPFQID